jgi:quercetin dioxygenase-like cupin family protein
MALTHLPSVSGKKLFPGVSGHYAHGDRTTVGEVILDPGAVVPMHQHPHEQVSYVVAGKLEFTVGKDVHVMEPGACLMIPGGAPHGCRAITPCKVIDIFAPVREDYR